MPGMWLMQSLSMTLILTCCGSATARDLPKLASVLAPVFLAEDIGALCEEREPGFLMETRGPLGSIHAYSRHMKAEATASLSVGETDLVLHTAAGSARDMVRRRLREMSDTAGVIGKQQFETWCATSAQPYVRQIVREHDEHHDRFSQAITSAERAPAEPGETSGADRTRP